jgi:hypothetical protein
MRQARQDGTNFGFIFVSVVFEVDPDWIESKEKGRRLIEEVWVLTFDMASPPPPNARFDQREQWLAAKHEDIVNSTVRAAHYPLRGAASCCRLLNLLQNGLSVTCSRLLWPGRWFSLEIRVALSVGQQEWPNRRPPTSPSAGRFPGESKETPFGSDIEPGRPSTRCSLGRKIPRYDGNHATSLLGQAPRRWTSFSRCAITQLTETDSQGEA